MPYIKTENRQMLADGEVTPENAGQLNYIITRECDAYLSFHGLSYSNINEVIGALECAKLELYRRVAVPYEDVKRKENGDVYTLGSIDDSSSS